jgi:hypothetical protein
MPRLDPFDDSKKPEGRSYRWWRYVEATLEPIVVKVYEVERKPSPGERGYERA